MGQMLVHRCTVQMDGVAEDNGHFCPINPANRLQKSGLVSASKDVLIVQV